jgi:mandelamide amidase
LAEAAAAIARGEFAAEAYAAALSARADVAADLDVFISRNEALAEEARAVDLRRARGEPLGPLAGAPLIIKDNIDVAGLPTTAGTPALRSWRPRSDAPVMRPLFAAGALVMGKANMQELALGITSNNAAFGAVRNPYDARLIAGGSSGGTGAGVAARLAPAGLGSDTAGSIRIPAGLCGVVGFRPSTGRWSQAGIVPLSHSRDTAGPMTRSVADAALLDAIVTGDEALPAGQVPGVRLGVPETHFWEDLDAEQAQVCRAALRRLGDAGAVLVPVDVRAIEAAAGRIGRTLTLSECIPDLAGYLDAAGAPMSAGEVIAAIASPDVAFGYRLAVEGRVSAEAYREARDVLQPRLRALYAELFRTHRLEALVFPATPLPARPVGQDDTVELNGRQADTRSAYLRNTEHGALAGLPGLVIPAGLTANGLPAGLEFDGPAGVDRRLLALGLGIEAVLGPIPTPGLT